jgi:hypothetical protein
MIANILERLFPDPCPELDWMSKGEAYWIEFYCWYSRFLPVRVYVSPADKADSWRFEWQWRGHVLWGRPTNGMSLYDG